MVMSIDRGWKSDPGPGDCTVRSLGCYSCLIWGISKALYSRKASCSWAVQLPGLQRRRPRRSRAAIPESDRSRAEGGLVERPCRHTLDAAAAYLLVKPR